MLYQPGEIVILTHSNCEASAAKCKLRIYGHFKSINFVEIPTVKIAARL